MRPVVTANLDAAAAADPSGGGQRLGLPHPLLRWTALAGVLLGVAYTVSPSSVWFVVFAGSLLVWAGRDLTPRERRWVWGLLGLALALRLLAIAALFLLSSSDLEPVGSIVPDGRYLKLRSLWVRNVALGIPTHWWDNVEAFHSYARSGSHYLLAAFQLALGPMTYGIHLLNTAFFVSGAVILYRTVRSAFGGVPALVGLAIILFLPTLFVWSVSALKDPLFFFLTSVCLASAFAGLRTKAWSRRVLAFVTCAAAIAFAGTLRQTGLIILGGGLLTGLGLRFFVLKARVMVACAALFVLATSFVVVNPAAQERVMGPIKLAGAFHYGFTNTPGLNYKLLDDHIYATHLRARRLIAEMTSPELARFVIRGTVSFVSTPLPWHAASPAGLAFIPQQMFWYLLFGLAVIGCYVGFWRDRLLTCILAGTIVLGATTVAFITGNVGTLVRFRDMVVPLIAWLSSLGACTVVEQVAILQGCCLHPQKQATVEQ
jgi:hypothetical protein